MIGSSAVDANCYPATAGLLDQVKTWVPQSDPQHRLGLAAATGRAMRVVSHAMSIGDHATACLMTEAFARLALLSSDPNEPAANPKDRVVLTNFAFALMDCAYPNAGEDLGINAPKTVVAEDSSDPDEVAYVNDLLAEFDAYFTSDEEIH